MAKLPEPFKPQGRKYFYFTYTDADGRRRQRSTKCTTKKDARAEIERFLSRPGSHTKLGEFAANFFIPGQCPWLAAQQSSDRQLRPGQIGNKRNHLTKWILPKWEKWPIEEITSKKLRDWLLSLECSSQTKRHVLYTFRAVLQEAVVDEVVSRNAAREVDPPSTRNAEHRDAFTAEEMQRLFPYTVEDIVGHIYREDDPDIPHRYGQRVGLRIWEEPKYLILGELMAHTGLRAGEAVVLTWGHIWDDEWIVLKQSKTGKHKVIYLPTKPRKLLQLWRRRSPWTEPEDYIFFGTGRENHVSNATMSRIACVAISRAGIEPRGRVLKGHSLRATYNTRLRRRVPDEILRSMTGHSSESMTELYDHPEQRELISRLKEYAGEIERALS